MASAREVRRRATGQSSAADKEHVAINASPKHYQSISKSCYVAGFAISASSWIDVITRGTTSARGNVLLREARNEN